MARLVRILALTALALATACSPAQRADAPVDTGTPAPQPATAAGLTAHERVACARWSEALEGQHQASIEDLHAWVRDGVANEAWVDAPAGRVRTAALAVADAVLHGGAGGSVATTGQALSAACTA